MSNDALKFLLNEGNKKKSWIFFWSRFDKFAHSPDFFLWRKFLNIVPFTENKLDVVEVLTIPIMKMGRPLPYLFLGWGSIIATWKCVYKTFELYESVERHVHVMLISTFLRRITLTEIMLDVVNIFCRCRKIDLTTFLLSALRVCVVRRSKKCFVLEENKNMSQKDACNHHTGACDFWHIMRSCFLLLRKAIVNIVYYFLLLIIGFLSDRLSVIFRFLVYWYFSLTSVWLCEIEKPAEITRSSSRDLFIDTTYTC